MGFPLVPNIQGYFFWNIPANKCFDMILCNFDTSNEDNFAVPFMCWWDMLYGWPSWDKCNPTLNPIPCPCAWLCLSQALASDLSAEEGQEELIDWINFFRKRRDSSERVSKRQVDLPLAFTTFRFSWLLNLSIEISQPKIFYNRRTGRISKIEKIVKWKKSEL